MARPTLPASVIAQRGKKITLIDDSEVAVVFTFSSLMTIEEDFGSMAAALEAVQDAEKGKAFTSLARILAAGLEHAYLEGGARLDVVDNLRAMLDPLRFASYSDALGEAFAAAFPQPEPGAGDDDVDPPVSSLGESGTTSPPSPSDAPTMSSAG